MVRTLTVLLTHTVQVYLSSVCMEGERGRKAQGREGGTEGGREGGVRKAGGRAGGGVQCAYTSTQYCTQHSSAPSQGPGVLGQDAVGPMHSAL